MLTEAHADKLEAIKIATDWRVGLELSQRNENFFKTGFLGKGYNKVGIYVSSCI